VLLWPFIIKGCNLNLDEQVIGMRDLINARSNATYTQSHDWFYDITSPTAH